MMITEQFAKIEYKSKWDHYLGSIFEIMKLEILKFWRTKSRWIGSIFQGFLFLIVFGLMVPGIGGVSFLAPGIIVLSLLFSGIFMGISVLIDKQFGFLKEIQVSPVPRTTIIVGKLIGYSICSLFQALLITFASIFLGAFPIDLFLVVRILLIIPACILFSMIIVGIGVTIASRMKDFHSFNLIITFLVMPMFFLSGAFFPINSLHPAIQGIMMINPAVYAVDLFRFILTNVALLPIILDIFMLVGFAVLFVLVGVYFFRKMEV